MQDQSTVNLIARMISQETGRNSALSAVLVSLLTLLKDNPEVANAVRAALEKQHSDHLATGQNPVHMDGYETARDMFYAALNLR